METLLATAALLGMATSAPPAGVQLVIPLAGDIDRRIVRYQCEGVENPVLVEYINAQPNFLALVPVNGQQVVFVTAISGSGARYVSGPYEWWSTGTEATFSDVRADPAAAVPCGEVVETP